MNEKQDDFYSNLGDQLLAVDAVKCEVFGCCNRAFRKLQFAPGTIVSLCKECYSRESEDIIK